MYNATDLTKKMMTSFSDVMNTIPTGFLSSFFGKNPTELSISDNDAVEIDIERGNEKIAVDVSRGGDGNLNTYGKYSTKLYVPPLYNEYTNVSARQLTKRLAGQLPNDPVNKTANAMKIIFNAQFENSKKILRAIELQAAQALFSGTITFKNADVMDFKRKGTHNITPDKGWNETGGAPLTDLALACERIRTDGKLPADIAIFGKRAWDYFIKDTNVQAMLNNRRMEFGFVQPRFANDGAVYQASVWVGSYRIECYTYDQYYVDANGVTQTYVPEDQVVVMNSGLRAMKCFGSVDILMPAEEAYRALGIQAIPMMAAGQIVPYYYSEKESNLVAGVKSAPLLVPTQIDAIVNVNAIADEN